MNTKNIHSINDEYINCLIQNANELEMYVEYLCSDDIFIVNKVISTLEKISRYHTDIVAIHTDKIESLNKTNNKKLKTSLIKKILQRISSNKK
jgi:hypothetical protein